MTPRETAIRMLEHMPDDVSYEDIMRQLSILRYVELSTGDVELVEPLFSWHSLAEYSNDESTSRKATWIY